MGFQFKYFFFPLFSLGMHTWYAYNIYVLLPFSVLEFVEGNKSLVSFKEIILSCFFVAEAALIILSSIFGGFIGDYLFYPIYRKFGVGRWKIHLLFGTAILFVTIISRAFFVVRWNHENTFITWLFPFLPKESRTFTITSILSFTGFSLQCCIGDISYGIMSVGFYCFFNQNLPEQYSAMIGGLTTSAETLGFLVGVTLFGSIYPTLGTILCDLSMGFYFLILSAPLIFLFEERPYKKLIHKRGKRAFLKNSGEMSHDEEENILKSSPSNVSESNTEDSDVAGNSFHLKDEISENSQQNKQETKKIQAKVATLKVQSIENANIGPKPPNSKKKIAKGRKHREEDIYSGNDVDLSTFVEKPILDEENELLLGEKENSQKMQEKTTLIADEQIIASPQSEFLDLPVSDKKKEDPDSERESFEMRESLDLNNQESTNLLIASGNTSATESARVSMDYNSLGRPSFDNNPRMSVDYYNNNRESLDLLLEKEQKEEILGYGENTKKKPQKNPIRKVKKARKSGKPKKSIWQIIKSQCTWKKFKSVIWWKDFLILFFLVVIEMNVLYSVQEWIGYFLNDVIKPENFTIPIPVFDGDFFKFPRFNPVQVTRSVEQAESICLFISNLTGVIFSAVGGLLSQLIGPKLTLALAFAVSGVFSILYCIFPIYSAIMALQILIGIGDGFFFPAQLLYQNFLFYEKEKESTKSAGETDTKKKKVPKDPKIGIGIGVSSTAFIFPNVILTPLAGLILSLLKPFERVNVFGWEIRGTNYKILYLFDFITCVLFMVLSFFITNRRSDKKKKGDKNKIALKDVKTTIQNKDEENLKEIKEIEKSLEQSQKKKKRGFFAKKPKKPKKLTKPEPELKEIPTTQIEELLAKK